MHRLSTFMLLTAAGAAGAAATAAVAPAAVEALWRSGSTESCEGSVERLGTMGNPWTSMHSYGAWLLAVLEPRHAPEQVS